MALSAPQQNGDLLNQSDIENHTLIVAPTEFIAHIPTVHTKPGEQSPAIRVNVIDLSDPSGQPVKYAGVLWFGVISGSLKRQIGETILGRMAKGTATPGKNPPWQLQDIMTEQAWVDYANQWLATPEGEAWEVENINEINRLAQAASATGQVQQAAAPVQQSAPPAPPAGLPPTTVSGPPSSVPSGPPQVPTAPPAPATSITTQTGGLPPGLEQLIAALPADQQAAARAVMVAQQGAAS